MEHNPGQLESYVCEVYRTASMTMTSILTHHVTWVSIPFFAYVYTNKKKTKEMNGLPDSQFHKGKSYQDQCL